jgi:Cu(I)/Ag(I) efflux system periplasmic protein CusF
MKVVIHSSSQENTMFRAVAIALVLSLPAAGTYAQSSSSHADHGMPGKTERRDATHTAAGVVKKVEGKSGTVSIAHEPVKSLNWPRMTMSFRVADKALLDKLPADKKIDFEFEQRGKDYVITGIK